LERVQIVEGETPVLLIAPHGADETNTDIIAEEVAENFGAYAVINKGWKKSRTVDYWKDLANCNNIRHLHTEVVKEEFLDPILRYVANIKRRYDDRVTILVIHGCDNKTKEEADDKFLDIILGFGAGRPPSYSCSSRIKNAFAYYLQRQNFVVYDGKPGGRYCGRHKNSLNQLFRLWHPDEAVSSLQIQIADDIRQEREIKYTVEGITEALDALMLLDDTTKIPKRTIKKI
jgi:hypothetical protein